MCLNKVLVFILVFAVGALALTLMSVSTVALMAQASALASQCVMALALMAIGAVIVAQIVMRNRIAQIYIARRLLGGDADRILQNGHSQPQAIERPGEARQLEAPAHLPEPVQFIRQAVRQPIVPAGWGFGEFDEED